MTTLAPDELEFCDRQAEPEDQDVTFCDESENDDPKDVKFCESDCPEDTLSIGGTETPSNGSTYTVSGGTGPYTWSISKGSITRSGATATVTVSGECGSATISVTDKCGNTATKDVRLPTGQWVQVGSISDEGGTNGCAADCRNVIYSGSYRYGSSSGGAQRRCCPYEHSYGDHGCQASGDTGGHDCNSLAALFTNCDLQTCDDPNKTYWCLATVFRWECP